MRRLLEQIARFFYYGWNMRNAYEFDSYSVFLAEELAVARLVKFMKSNKTHCVWNSSNETNLMRKLLEFQEVQKRVCKGSYTENFVKVSKEIHGEDYFISDDFLDRMNRKLPDSQEKKLRRAMKRDRMDEVREWDRYCYLRKKYIRQFWD